MSTVSRLLLGVCAIAVQIVTSGCATCKDHLLISIQNAESHEPVVGAEIEFRPPMAVLPPPVWRGRTDAKGELRECVDLDGIGLVMTVCHDGKIYGRSLHTSHFLSKSVIDAVYNPEGGGYPQLRIIVERLE